MILIFLIAVSLSVDALGVGITYGLNKKIMPCVAKIIMSLIACIITFLSLNLGYLIQKFLSEQNAKFIGATILTMIGIYFILSAFRSHERARIHKNMSISEGFFVGIALSIDSIGSGIGLSILGYKNFLLPLFTAFAQYIFLSLGFYLANKISNKRTNKNILAILSGVILIFIACIRFFS